MSTDNKNYIPSVNDFLNKIKQDNELNNINEKIIKRNIRNYIKNVTLNEIKTEKTKESVLEQFTFYIKNILKCPLKPVINATGIILHTNLGRAPLSPKVFEMIQENCTNYTNIEFDLIKSKRAYRDDYLKDIFNFITGAEDVVVVNNNAAAIYLITKVFTSSQLRTERDNPEIKRTKKRPEIIISRGELIEIGGSFRIPDMLKDAGAKLIEVGTTNCTRITDYEKAINENTAMIFKAHTSNFTISGHTESTPLEELVALSKKHNIPFVYDAGSGLLNSVIDQSLRAERGNPVTNQSLRAERGNPVTEFVTVADCIEKDIDIICFSGDKLLGATQAGIILGKSKYLKLLKKHPLMRVLRADKLTITNLWHSVSMYKSEKELLKHNKVYSMLSHTPETLKSKAESLSEKLSKYGINHKIINAFAQIGGGALPDVKLQSYEILLELKKSEDLHYKLLTLEKPILTILKERKLFINIFTVDESDFDYVAVNINGLIKNP